VGFNQSVCQDSWHCGWPHASWGRTGRKGEVVIERRLQQGAAHEYASLLLGLMCSSIGEAAHLVILLNTLPPNLVSASWLPYREKKTFHTQQCASVGDSAWGYNAMVTVHALGTSTPTRTSYLCVENCN
jgi:hypothetical protein